MKQKFLHFTMIATILLFVACSNEGLLSDATDLDTPPTTERTLSLSATMPEPTTRVVLNAESGNVKVRWRKDDEIQLAFYVDASNKFLEKVTVASTSNDGKTAHFNIPIPNGLVGDFTLYGVYGGGGINMGDNNTYPAIKLPTHPGSDIDNDMVIFFEKAMTTSDGQASVTFQHLGALFNIKITNHSKPLMDNIKEMRLVGVTPGNDDWVYGTKVDGNFSKGGSYCLVNSTFLSLENAGNYISFAPTRPRNSSVPGTYWTWYPILPGKVLPELQLQVIDVNNDVVSESSNSKPVRDSAPEAGHSYRFSVVWDEANEKLNFVPDPTP